MKLNQVKLSMREETENWLKYSIENYKAAKILLKGGLFNPCLQNIQQSVEKALKAVVIEKSIALKKRTVSLN